MTGGDLNAPTNQRITKTYLVTGSEITKLPIDFISSRNQKWIQCQNCRCVYTTLQGNDYLTADIQLHADFIERDQYLDSFVCFTNTIMTKYKKWEVRNPKQHMKVWFSNMDGEILPIIKDGSPLVGIKSFVLELMLIY